MTPLDSLLAGMGDALWTVSWQVTVLIAFIGILSLFFRKASSSFRYFLWCIVLARLMIPVKLESPAIVWNGINALFCSFLPSMRPDIPFSSVFRALPETSGVYGGTETLIPVPASQPISDPGTSAVVLAALWLLTVLAALILAAVHLARTHRLLKTCPPVERAELLDLLDASRCKMGIAQRVPLRYLDIPGHGEPSVAGIVSPSIYLPRNIADLWNVREIEPILLHELSHIRRHDTLINMFQAFVQILYIFHPLVWLVNRRIRVLREEVCDDISIQMLGGQSGRYARSMLGFILEPSDRFAWGFSGIGFGEGTGSISKRVRRIMKKGFMPSRRLGVFSVALLLAVGTAGLALSSAQPRTGGNPGGKAIESLKERGVLDKIIIGRGPMEQEKKKSIGEYLTNSGEKDRISFRIVQGKGKQFQPPEALSRMDKYLVSQLGRYTNLDVKEGMEVSLDSPALTDAPFVYIAADKAFALTANERKSWGKYLRNGGFALIDNGAPEYEYGPAEDSLRKMLRDALGKDARFQPIPNDFPIYHCFFDFDGPPMGKPGDVQNRKFMENRYLEGIWLGERLAAVYCNYGYGYRWGEPDKSEPQVKLAVNLVVFALLQEDGMITRNAAKP